MSQPSGLTGLDRAAQSPRLGRDRRRSGRVGFAIRFPGQADHQALALLVAGQAGIAGKASWVSGLPVWWYELVADCRGITHRLLVPSSHQRAVEDLLQAHLPRAQYRQLEEIPEFRPQLVRSWRTSARSLPLGIDVRSMSRSLMTVLHPLAGGEQVLIQWGLLPARIPGRSGSNAPSVQRARPQTLPSPTERLFWADLRVGVRTPRADRHSQIIFGLASAFQSGIGSGAGWRRRLIPNSIAVRMVRDRLVWPWNWPILFSAEEAVGMLALPVEVDQLAGLSLAGCPRLPVPVTLPRQGLILGDGTFPGTSRPVALSSDARARHLHLIGPTGVGKTTLLLNLIVQDLKAGHGLTVLDPKGDLITDVLARVPEVRRDDVIVVDPSDPETVVGFNPLTPLGGSLQTQVENVMGTIMSLWQSSWGPRTDDLLRAAMMTVARHPELTLVELGAVLSDPSWRQRLTRGIDDPVGLSAFWSWFESLSPAERTAMVAAPLNKLRALTIRPGLRRTLGQSEPGLNFRQVLDHGRVVLINLSPGNLGEQASALVGSLVLAQLWQATTSRADQSARSRRLHVAYLDEFQRFTHLTTDLGTALAEARSYGLGFVLAHQHLAQLPKPTRSAVLANTRSRIVFQTNREDSQILARELGSQIEPADLMSLGPFEVVASLYAAGRVQPPTTLRTRPEPQAVRSAPQMRSVSLARYGRPVCEIDAEITARHRPEPAPSQVIGQRRRPQRNEGDSK